MSNMVFIKAEEAFKEAVAQGRLNEDIQSPYYAGDWMYMGTIDEVHRFKNRFTRTYLSNPKLSPKPSPEPMTTTIVLYQGVKWDDILSGMAHLINLDLPDDKTIADVIGIEIQIKKITATFKED